MVYTLRFFPSKCSLFHNSNVFSSCIIHISYTECAKIKKKNNYGAKRTIIHFSLMFRFVVNFNSTKTGWPPIVGCDVITAYQKQRASNVQYNHCITHHYANYTAHSLYLANKTKQ